MKSSSFYVIQGWMINELQLKGNELLVFAIIYGFSKDNQGKFDGSLKYLSDATGSSRSTIIKTLNSLLEKEFILKEVITVNNIQFCKYFQNELVVLNSDGDSTILNDLGSTKITPNNIINNNIDNKKKILFSDSIYNNYDTLRNKLKTDVSFVEKYAGVDLKHYIEDVLLWSDSKTEKRDNVGWLATIRNWIKRDLKENKMVLMKDYKPKENIVKDGHINY